jgi:hypothetical protein
MGALHSKVQVLVLNAQGGKTRRIQDLIREDEAANPGSYLNFVIQANNRALVAQTGARMSTELYAGGGGGAPAASYEDDEAGPSDARIEGNVFSWFSGGGPRITPDDVVGKMVTGEVTMVICCANRRRLDYLEVVITKMEAALARFRSPIKMRIWWDEADAAVPYLRDAGYQAVMRKPVVDKVTLVSATIDALVKEFKTLRIIPLKNTTLPIYFRVQDYEVNIVGDTRVPAADFFQCVVESNIERYFTPGARTFAPGSMERKSHEAIAAIAFARGAVVVVINGKHKEIRIPGEGVIQLPLMKADSECEEIGRAIGRLYHEKNLGRFPLFVTGHICLGRGITFQNDLFLFDHQILPPHFDERAVAYQAAGRGAGNIRALPNFLARAATGFRPTLTTTANTWRLIVEAETIASTLAPSVRGRASNVVNADDLAIAAEPRNLLQFCHVPVWIPLPAAFKAEQRGDETKVRGVRQWQEDVMAHIAEVMPDLHASLAPYKARHVDHYFFGGPTYPLFRRIKDAGKAGMRAPVPKFQDMRQDHCYVEIDHSHDHMLVCRFDGSKIPSDWKGVGY